MTGETVMIPTSLVVCVATYLVGVYVAFIVVGWQRSYCDIDEIDDTDVFVAFLWPLAVFILCFTMLREAVSGLHRKLSVRNPVAVRRIASMLSWLTLPFRPWRIGKMIRRKGGTR